MSCFFQLISLLSFRFSRKAFFIVLCFIKFCHDVFLAISTGPILWHSSTSFSVIFGTCKSLFIFSLTDFVADASASFLRLLIPSITRNGRRDYCSWSSNFSHNVRRMLRKSQLGFQHYDVTVKMIYFFSKDMFFPFCFVMISRSSRCIFTVMSSLGNYLFITDQ